jgi:hypothetical protein
MDMKKFAIPQPVEYNPRSVFYRYRYLLILFVAIFVAAMSIGHHLIQVQRDKPLPLAPVFFVDTDTEAPKDAGDSAAKAH